MKKHSYKLQTLKALTAQTRKGSGFGGFLFSSVYLSGNRVYTSIKISLAANVTIIIFLCHDQYHCDNHYHHYYHFQ